MNETTDPNIDWPDNSIGSSPVLDLEDNQQTSQQLLTPFKETHPVQALLASTHMRQDQMEVDCPQSDQNIRRPTEGQNQVIKKIVLIGQTGSGKSTIGNCLLSLDPSEGFDVSRGADSCTEDTRAIRGTWCTNGELCEITDTPGMDDSNNRDTEHIENIIEHLKEGKFINSFVLVRNGQNKRMSNSFKSMLTIFELMFGAEFWKHVVVDVSHIKYEDKEEMVQEVKDWKKTMKRTFIKAKNTYLPTVFLDAKDPNNPRFLQNANDLWSHIQIMADFECKDFETTKTEMDELKSDRNQLRRDIAIFKLNAEKEMKQLLKDADEHKRAIEEKLDDARLQAKQTEDDKVRAENEADKLKQEKEEVEMLLRKEKEEATYKHMEELKRVTYDAQAGLAKIFEAMKSFKEDNHKTQEAFILNTNTHIENLISRHSEKMHENVEKKIEDLGNGFQRHMKDLSSRIDQQEQDFENTKASYESKISDMVEEGKKSEEDFEKLYPSLKTREDELAPWKNLQTENKKSSIQDNFQKLLIISEKGDSVINKDGSIAARVLRVSGVTNQKPTKTLLVVGMTGSGKSTLIDALVNYVYDVRYEDAVRLNLIDLTANEVKKQSNQANSQTDYITVYSIEWVSGMNIDYNLVIIDTPGLGDTRGIDYDKKMIKNIKTLFNSKEVDSLDCIGFVAKSGDVRLTAEQKYIFESILQIFGKDVGENLISLLTFYDGYDLKVLDAFKKARILFVDNLPYNSLSIFQRRTSGPVERSLLTTDPNVSFYQDFYKNSDKLFQKVQSMKPKSLVLTQEVLKDREHIEATVEGLNIRVRELLLLKDRVDQEKRICEQHEADAKANEDTEYEVEESKVVKIDLNPGEFVTNCLECNRTCHYPCYIPTDEDKYNCAAMSRGETKESTSCTVCPQKCHWQQHRNMSFRLDVETSTVKKTYEDIKARHQEYLDLHEGQITIVQALEIESQGLSEEIQQNVDFITECLHRLSKNALRTSTTSSAEYLEQMIQAENHERKPGFQRRMDQLMKEKAKADALANIQSGKEIVTGIQITARKVQKPRKIGIRKLHCKTEDMDDGNTPLSKAAKTGKKIVQGAVKALGL